MTLIPNDFPQRLAARGVPVKVIGGWEPRGGSADHNAVVIHHTASSATTSPSSDANYCAVSATNAPLYNVFVDRSGVAWILARERSANAGQISGVALREVIEGHANLTPAAQRKLKDTTSANSALFGLCGQNDGRGEPWAPALVNNLAITAAVALESLGLWHAGYVTTHRALTARKIDPAGPNCPHDWHALINPLIRGGSAPGPTPGPPLTGKRELMLIEQPGRTIDPVRLACIELRPEEKQIIGWNGASIAGDALLVRGDERRRGECRVLDLKPYTNNNIVGWKEADGGCVFVTDGDGGTFFIEFS